MKRAFDITLAVFALVVLAPLLGLTALAVLLSDGRPVLFRQSRVGKGGRCFEILKFRTMRASPSNSPRITVSGDSRVTRLGSFLRQTKLDELPQLLNVLRGEMSFVGPRPEVPEYVALYTPGQRRVLDLTPGITDIASLKYRHESEILAAQKDPHAYYVDCVMPDKIALNLQYADKASLLTDLGVIAKTATRLVA